VMSSLTKTPFSTITRNMRFRMFWIRKVTIRENKLSKLLKAETVYGELKMQCILNGTPLSLNLVKKLLIMMTESVG